MVLSERIEAVHMRAVATEIIVNENAKTLSSALLRGRMHPTGVSQVTGPRLPLPEQNSD